MVFYGEEPVVQLDGHLAAAHVSLGEGLAGDDIFCLEELGGEVVGAGDREAEGPACR